LPPEALFPVDDHRALARAIDERLGDPAWMAAASARNLTSARAYHDNELHGRRMAFYQTLKNMTANWWAKHPDVQSSTPR